MASPCEIIVDTPSKKMARRLIGIGVAEALRIEKSFSRYRDDNIIHTINQSNGKQIAVNNETAEMLDFADQCFQLSDGLFDITSGVLRKAWVFDGSAALPEQCAIDALLPLVGWQKVNWQRPKITLPAGMQIDLGGIGKEYAVDRALTLIRQAANCPVLVNFGGDLHASAAPINKQPWHVGIEHMQGNRRAVSSIQLFRGALTTSGDTHRYLEKDGRRYGHVLSPKTGWPVPDAPHTVTVASNSCTEAGILSTLAMLQGIHAERFLDEEGVRYWCQR